MTELEKYKLLTMELVEVLDRRKTEIAFLQYEIDGLRQRLEDAEMHDEGESRIHSTADAFGIERRNA